MVDQGKMTKYLANKYWVKTPVANKKRPREKLTVSDKNQGLCNAVITLRDIIAVYEYHTTPEIEKIITAQVDRIGAAFEYLETGPLKATTFTYRNDPNTPITYSPMATSLKAQWEEYMAAKYDKVIEEIEEEMTLWTGKLKSVKVKRALQSAEKRGTGNTRSDLCGEEPNKTDMNKRIDLVLEAYANKGTWKNPMKP